MYGDVEQERSELIFVAVARVYVSYSPGCPKGRLGCLLHTRMLLQMFSWIAEVVAVVQLRASVYTRGC